MIHYTCDLCGRTLGRERFEAKIEVAPAFDPDELTEEDLDSDNLEQIAEEISKMESTGEFEIPQTGPQKLRFDFCSGCARRFVTSPFQTKRAQRVTYSEN